jgi:hypothetical protein
VSAIRVEIHQTVGSGIDGKLNHATNGAKRAARASFLIEGRPCTFHGCESVADGKTPAQILERNHEEEP